jgi:hypothetical protein
LHQVCQAQQLRDPGPGFDGQGRTRRGVYLGYSHRPGDGQLGAGPIGQLDQVAQAGVGRVPGEAHLSGLRRIGLPKVKLSCAGGNDGKNGFRTLT